MCKKRECPDGSHPDCPGYIEEDRGPTAERCKLCSGLRTRRREAARRRELTRLAREGRKLSATRAGDAPPTAGSGRKCPDCPGDSEEDRGPTAHRCKRCSALRTRSREAARRRRLRREARELDQG